MPQYQHHILVSIPCHLELYVRFSIIRLSDDLLPAAFKVLYRFSLLDGRCGHRVHETVGFCSYWPPGIACAGVLVICPWVLLALLRHTPSLTSSLSMVEAEVLPSHRVMLSRWSLVSGRRRRPELGLASVRRSNPMCGFPALGFHKGAL